MYVQLCESFHLKRQVTGVFQTEKCMHLFLCNKHQMHGHNTEMQCKL